MSRATSRGEVERWLRRKLGTGLLAVLEAHASRRLGRSWVELLLEEPEAALRFAGEVLGSSLALKALETIVSQLEPLADGGPGNPSESRHKYRRPHRVYDRSLRRTRLMRRARPSAY